MPKGKKKTMHGKQRGHAVKVKGFTKTVHGHKVHVKGYKRGKPGGKKG